MAHSRRDFIKKSALLSASLMLPNFLKALAAQTAYPSFKGKRLVIIQLSGGNDGLNCIIPVRNDLYYQLRPGIGLKEKDRIRLTDEVAINQNLKELADLYNAGHLAIINNVGYEHPNRSHFRSTDIWQSASHSHEYLSTGWVGRYLDSLCTPNCQKPHTAIELDDTLSLALKGDKIKGLAFHDPNILYLSSKNDILRNVSKQMFEVDDHSSLHFLHKTLRETTQSADYIHQQSKIYTSTQTYPNTDFGKRLKTVAELICSGIETQVYYISLPGFDTHALQLNLHSRVLKNYAQSLNAFCADLKQNNLFNDTVILTFSEFGRRVKQNASNGTDHGTANNVYIVSGALKKQGIINELPDLVNLDDGDLKHTVDYRQVYATLIDHTLGIQHSSILGKSFETFGLF